MILKFTKMHGCGNDYIYFNCFEHAIASPGELSVKLSDRHYGIGGDGIILVCPSERADAKMRMFNLDGSEGKMCGNGIRCVGKYLYDHDMVDKDEITIETLSGIKNLRAYRENGVVTKLRVDMGKASFECGKIPVRFEGERMINAPVRIGGREYRVTCVSMGNPHCVVFAENIDDICLEEIGPAFENSELFPEQVNTEFIEILNENTLKMRVWERGSGETLACGTGACAAVVAAVENGHCEKNQDITVKLRGGELVINYTDEAVYMTGRAEKVFEGVVEV